MVRADQQQPAGPNRGGEAGQEGLAIRGRHVHVLRGDEVVFRRSRRPGEHVAAPPLDPAGDLLPASLGVVAAAGQRGAGDVDRRDAPPCSASQMASAPSPHPTSSARPLAHAVISSTSTWFGCPLHIAGAER